MKSFLADAVTVVASTVNGIVRSLGFGTRSPNISGARAGVTFSTDQAADGERLAMELRGYCTTDGAVANYDWINGNNRLVALTGFRWGADNTGKLQLGLFSAGSYQAHVDFKVGLASFLLGDLAIEEVGKGLKVKQGSSGRMGAGVLVAGTVTVTCTNITANSKIFLSRSATGGTLGHLSYTISAGASFTINSSNAADTSTVNYLIVEPA